MSNKTVIILQDCEGEYDTYQEFVTDVYIINKKNFDIEKEWQKYYFTCILKETDIKVEWKKNHNEYDYIDFPKIKRIEIKQLHACYKKNTKKFFIEEVLKLKKINFTVSMQD